RVRRARPDRRTEPRPAADPQARQTKMTNSVAGHVLLVNSFDDREMYAEYLCDAGLLVHAVSDPAVALGLLPSISCDVAITDLVFAPGALSGSAFTRELRARLDPSTSIIVVSGCVRQEDREEAR